MRYFDVVVKAGDAVPVSMITINDSISAFEVVPVIYIKNEVMSLPNLDIEGLAGKVNALVNRINRDNKVRGTELQLDCDWTLKTKVNYFKFITILKRMSDKALSATIRLHQVKYLDKTGVPPVDKGILMFYNMRKIGVDPSNSIYDRDVSKRYIYALSSYPLLLKIALPIFSWGVHIRNGRVVGLVNKVDFETFESDKRFAMKSQPFFEVTENVLKLGHYFQKGDRIKVESISSTNLNNMISDLSEKMKDKPTEVIYYDLDEFNLKHFDNEEAFFTNISGNF